MALIQNVTSERGVCPAGGTLGSSSSWKEEREVL